MSPTDALLAYESFVQISQGTRLYYRWKRRCEDMAICAYSVLPQFCVLTGSTSTGMLVAHSIVCLNANHTAFDFCGKKEYDIICSISGGLIGLTGAYFLNKYQLWDRLKCLCAL